MTSKISVYLDKHENHNYILYNYYIRVSLDNNFKSNNRAGLGRKLLFVFTIE